MIMYEAKIPKEANHWRIKVCGNRNEETNFLGLVYKATQFIQNLNVQHMPKDLIKEWMSELQYMHNIYEPKLHIRRTDAVFITTDLKLNCRCNLSPILDETDFTAWSLLDWLLVKQRKINILQRIFIRPEFWNILFKLSSVKLKITLCVT
jgi:hypothetical protein